MDIDHKSSVSLLLILAIVAVVTLCFYKTKVEVSENKIATNTIFYSVIKQSSEFNYKAIMPFDFNYVIKSKN